MDKQVDLKTEREERDAALRNDLKAKQKEQQKKDREDADRRAKDAELRY